MAMYEFTMGGAWFRWSLLDKTSKLLAGGSLAAAALAAFPLGIAFGRVSYAFGKQLGSGGRTSSASVPTLEPWHAGLFLAFSILSGLLWWRFSLRQDEMFNRLQNWALGMGSACSATLLSILAMLDLAELAPPISPLAIIGIFYLLILVFWFAAVRRWV